MQESFREKNGERQLSYSTGATLDPAALADAALARADLGESW